MSSSHHPDPGKPLEMTDLARLLMERCGENIKTERAHTNEKFRLERAHTNETLEQIVNGLGSSITKLTSNSVARCNNLESNIADLELKLDTVSRYQEQLLLNLKASIQDTLQNIGHDIRCLFAEVRSCNFCNYSF